MNYSLFRRGKFKIFVNPNKTRNSIEIMVADKNKLDKVFIQVENFCMKLLKCHL